MLNLLPVITEKNFLLLIYVTPGLQLLINFSQIVFLDIALNYSAKLRTNLFVLYILTILVLFLYAIIFCFYVFCFRLRLK